MTGTRMHTEPVWHAATNIRVLTKMGVLIVGIGMMRMIIVQVVSAGRSIGWNTMVTNGNLLKTPITVEILKKMADMVVFLMRLYTVA